jgi:hypothetical protein
MSEVPQMPRLSTNTIDLVHIKAMLIRYIVQPLPDPVSFGREGRVSVLQAKNK